MFFTKPHSLSSKFTFGKYVNKTIKDVLILDPEYLEWCVDNVENFNLDSEASNALENIMEDL